MIRIVARDALIERLIETVAWDAKRADAHAVTTGADTQSVALVANAGGGREHSRVALGAKSEIRLARDAILVLAEDADGTVEPEVRRANSFLKGEATKY